MKRFLLNNIIVLTTAIVLPCLSFASEQGVHEHGAHVHGAAKLQVAIDGNTVTLMLESPMESLVGFEHAPGSEAEKSALAKLVGALNKPYALFVFSPAAGCASSSVKLQSPLIADAAHEDKHEHQHDDKNDTHSDLDGEFVFTCKAADKLAGLTVNLFDVAANLQDLDVEVAGPDKQTAAELSSKTRSMNW